MKRSLPPKDIRRRAPTPTASLEPSAPHVRQNKTAGMGAITTTQKPRIAFPLPTKSFIYIFPEACRISLVNAVENKIGRIDGKFDKMKNFRHVP